MELIVKVIKYNEKENICRAIVKNMNQCEVNFDPFVSSAAYQLFDDWDYDIGPGPLMVNKIYCVSTYSYYGEDNELVPDEFGIKEIYKK